ARPDRDHERGERANGPVEREVERDDEESEEGEVAEDGRPRLVLQIAVDVGPSHLADALERRRNRVDARDHAIDGGEDLVPLRGARDAQSEWDSQEAVSHEPLLAEELGARREPA